MTHRSIVLLIIAAGVIGCSTSGDSTLDTAGAALEHDPSLHAEHTAGGAATTASDTSFTAMQARGAVGMGVDQYTSTHTFEPRPDGGRITLRRDVEDSAGVAQIRAHLAGIAASFAAGDFTTPAFVHAGTVPGTDVMAARRGAIRYSVAPIARGGALLMQTSDSAAIEAIHRFLTFQRGAHRAGSGTDSGRTPPP